MAVDTIEKVLYALIKAAGVAGTIVGTRIYPLVRPQDSALPAVTYQRISGNRDFLMDGAHNMASERFQINCFASTYSGCEELADAVRDGLNGYSGTANTIVVHVMILENETDLVDEVPDVRGARVYGRALDFTIWWKEGS